MNNMKNGLDKSNALLADARNMIAGVTQSMMKKPEQFCLGKFPVYLESGNGAEVTDVDDNTYIDYICGLGANALGHNYPAVTAAISQNLHKGLLHSLPAPVEVKTAKALIDIIPHAQMVRFFKTGADANSAAVRLARFCTQKDKIVTVGYNGWHDHYMFDTPGVPKTIAEFTYRMPLFQPSDEQPLLDLIEDKGDELAAVLLSIPYNRELSPDFFQQVKNACNAHNIIFIIDEVVSGFRLAKGGAQEYFNVEADLVTLSKGLAAGMPLSAVAGKKALLDEMEKLQVSTTFGGEMLSLEVCAAAIDTYQTTNYISHIHALGKKLKEGINQAAERLNAPLRVVGYDAIPMFLFAKNPAVHVKLAEPFVGLMAAQGFILRRDVNFLCAAHTEQHIEKTIDAVTSALQKMLNDGLFTHESSALNPQFNDENKEEVCEA
ncbi:aminotransferase class III-fold pyridoxal phosphate-dependent enzyme [Marinagarivorans cellulosilyticus]|uniref:Aminotransferase MxcL n=1 Tax=Marinagarivorans cellulosilyticus TaxID=2721545 RepID=A0AAN1WFG7_9GAMM|nr:aminotransferase class III-fold pyridoxal phosphate-dependent enzyme [Marinagarivorans cellulosilyticus]BCD96613.1 aminotransferase MxcL [Marinagarivorans cellulosilyticus]